MHFYIFFKYAVQWDLRVRNIDGMFSRELIEKFEKNFIVHTNAYFRHNNMFKEFCIFYRNFFLFKYLSSKINHINCLYSNA